MLQAMSSQAFGEYLRIQRFSKGYTSGRAFAHKVGISPQLLSRIERGNEKGLGEAKLIKIAELLSLNPDEVLAMNGKVASDVTEILLKKPRALANLVRRLEGRPATVIDAIEAQHPKTEPLTFYPLEQVSRENHTAIIGETGSGKSLLTQYLIHTYFKEAEDILIYDSDASPYDWAGLPVEGMKGDYLTILEGMSGDLIELQHRTERHGEGLEVGGEYVRVIEEYPSTAAELHEYAPNLKAMDEPGDLGVRWLRKLLRRGRKYKIKFFAVAQEFEVNAWKIAGEGGLRKAFTVLYLGAMAYQALYKIKDKANRDQLRRFLDECDHPCLVDLKGRFYPVQIPDLTQFKSEQSAPCKLVEMQ